MELKDFHLKMAKENFNKTWDYIDLGEKRTKQDTLNMIHSAHASRFHWQAVGTPLNLQRGEWQISRVYSLANMPESALYHANACLELTLDNDIKDFDLAFAHEAMARAYMIAGDVGNKDKHKRLALETAELIKDKGNKDYTLSEINNIK
ncbi:hypothetical protein RJG79_03390 [Mycoplasmatota bacterium WC44]